MRAFLGFLAVAALGCGGPTEVDIDQDFTLAFGKSATIEGTDVTVTFEDVLEDTRCANDTDCLWAGNARIQLGVNTPTRHVILNTYTEPNYGILYRKGIRELAVQVQTLLPHREIGGTIDRRAYRVTLKAMWWERLEG